MKILVVDDDNDLRPLVAFALRQAGFLAVEAASGERALTVFAAERPDLVILDLNLPGIDGFEVCRRLRTDRDATPVLMLTVRGDEEDVVRGLETGADDYLTKPFSPRTLIARVRALLRRSAAGPARPLVSGDLELDEELRTVRIAGAAPIRLAPLEFRLLRALAAHSGQPVPAERLLRQVWGARGEGDRQLLKQLVHRLRQKIENDPAAPQRLCTEAGIGYRLLGQDRSGSADPLERNSVS